MSHASSAVHGHAEEGDAHGHGSHVAHHFVTAKQQFNSAKVGMWVFLATEILMFGGLFVAYSVWRANHPEVFEQAHTQLNKTYGGINTVFLITSSFTMAWAVRTSQLGKTKATVLLLLATLAGGGAFLCVKYVEYSSKWEHGLFVGPWNQYHPGYEGSAHDSHEPGTADAEATLDGQAASAQPPEPTREEASATDAAAAGESGAAQSAGGQVGRASPAGPEVSSIAPPPQGPPGLVESFQMNPVAAAGSSPHGGEHGDGVEHGGSKGGDHAGHSADAHAVNLEAIPPTQRAQLHQFFQIYFLMTGLHTIHVIIGMGLIGWVALKAAKGVFGPEYFTPVDLTGLYWHLVDLIWIFLFPLLYLIH